MNSMLNIGVRHTRAAAVHVRRPVHVHVPAPAPAPPLESFYHRYLLEHHFPNGSAQRLSSGITDITTDCQHIEVKRWPCWKDAIGQLLVYNGDDPKKELRVYLFGWYATERKQKAVLHFSRLNIRVFDMFYDRSKHNVRIIEYHLSDTSRI